MAGGEPRLGTASIYMGASYRSPPLKQAKSTQLHGYNSRPSKQIRQRYRPLNRAERGKLRLEAAVVPTMMQSRDEGAYTVTGEEADHHPKSRRADRYLDMSHGNLATLGRSQ